MDNRPDPNQTRREGVDGWSITLADGRSWRLAMPSARLRLKLIPGVDSLGRPTETIQVETELGYPLEIRRLIGDLRSACDQGIAERHYETLIRLAAALICRAHEIELDEAVSLLELELDELPRLVEAVLSVVTGKCLDNAGSSRKSDIDG